MIRRTTPRPAWLLTLAFLLLPAGAARAAGPAQTDVEFFEKKVRPLLIENCFQCHSTGKKIRGGLLLDNRAGVIKGGDTGSAVVPGEPGKSLLVKAIGYKDEPRMPPRSKLNDEQIAALTTWVKMGAPWPVDSGAAVTGPANFDLEKRKQHWSFQPLKSCPIPEVHDRQWPRSPLDHFILARLEAANLKPAPEIDRRTWLRRVTFDLIGLPPTPAEIDAFLADASPQSYDKVVDRLLAAPAYGERWGRHWLDLVRFAETSGHEFDFDIPEAYLYRDYVIRAFNADVPYDQLVREHIAGDLLPSPRRHPVDRYNESILGTGFWFLGESKHSPVDLRGDGSDRRDNQVDVFAKTFLGLTVACARCHDHKFDAITTRDYYSLVSYLQSSRQQRAFLDDPEHVGGPLRQLRKVQAEARQLAVNLTARSLRQRLDKLAPLLLATWTDEQVDSVPDLILKAWRASIKAVDPGQSGSLFHAWRVLGDPELTPTEQFQARRKQLVEQLKAETARAAASGGQAVLFEDFKKNGYRDWFITGQAFGSAPSMAADVVLEGSDLPVRKLIGSGVAHSGLVSDRLQGALRSRTFTIEKKHILYRVLGHGGRVNLIIDGYQQIRNPIYGGLTFAVKHDDHWSWHVQDVAMWVGQKAYIEVLDDGDGYIALDRILFADGGPPDELPNQLWLRWLDDPGLTNSAALARKYQDYLRELLENWRDGKLTNLPNVNDRIDLLNALLASEQLNVLLAAPVGQAASLSLPDGQAGSLPYEGPARQKLRALLEEASRVEGQLPAPRRGLAMADGTGLNERVHIRGNPRNMGEEAPRRFLEALAGPNQTPPRDGSGRLELAERMLAPSNPLLPRVIVNRLFLHHFGEGIVRSPDDFGLQGQVPTHPELLDYLAAELPRMGWSLKRMHRMMVLSSTYRMASRSDNRSELLDPQNKLWHRLPLRRLEAEAIRDAMLAVSGRLDRRMYGPGPLPYLTPFMVGRGRPASGPLDGDGRRSIYLNIRRNFLNPMFLAFDYPIPFSTRGRRGVSNVPAQALTLLNNPFVVQQAQLWARRVRAESGRTTRERISGMYVTAFGRTPTAAEMQDVLGFLEEQAREYGRNDDPRAWTDLGHVLFNVKEFIFVN